MPLENRTESTSRAKTNFWSERGRKWVACSWLLVWKFGQQQVRVRTICRLWIEFTMSWPKKPNSQKRGIKENRQQQCAPNRRLNRRLNRHATDRYAYFGGKKKPNHIMALWILWVDRHWNQTKSGPENRQGFRKWKDSEHLWDYGGNNPLIYALSDNFLLFPIIFEEIG